MEFGGLVLRRLALPLDTVEDGPDHFGLEDHGDALHLGPAAWAFHDINAKNAEQQGPPGDPAPTHAGSVLLFLINHGVTAGAGVGIIRGFRNHEPAQLRSFALGASTPK